jgi:hypothetical protein
MKTKKQLKFLDGRLGNLELIVFCIGFEHFMFCYYFLILTPDSCILNSCWHILPTLKCHDPKIKRITIRWHSFTRFMRKIVEILMFGTFAGIAFGRCFQYIPDVSIP